MKNVDPYVRDMVRDDYIKVMRELDYPVGKNEVLKVINGQRQGR